MVPETRQLRVVAAAVTVSVVVLAMRGLPSEQGLLSPRGPVSCDDVRRALNWCGTGSRDAWGWTLLHRAAVVDRPDVVELLLAKGANVNAVSHDGWTPLHEAAVFGRCNVARLLIDGGADLDAVDKTGRSPLHRAAMTANGQVAELLLVAGADPALRDIDGRTPRQLAVAFQHPALAHLIARYDSDQ